MTETRLIFIAVRTRPALLNLSNGSLASRFQEPVLRVCNGPPASIRCTGRPYAIRHPLWVVAYSNSIPHSAQQGASLLRVVAPWGVLARFTLSAHCRWRTGSQLGFPRRFPREAHTYTVSKELFLEVSRVRRRIPKGASIQPEDPPGNLHHHIDLCGLCLRLPLHLGEGSHLVFCLATGEDQAVCRIRVEADRRDTVRVRTESRTHRNGSATRTHLMSISRFFDQRVQERLIVLNPSAVALPHQVKKYLLGWPVVWVCDHLPYEIKQVLLPILALREDQTRSYVANLLQYTMSSTP